MKKSELTISPARSTGGYARGLRRRLWLAILAGLALLTLTPAVSQAADGLSHVNTNNTNLNGQTLNFGTNGQGNLPSSVTIYLWSNSASGGFLNLSTRTINADVRLNNPNYIRNGGSCGSGSTQPGYTFRASYSYQGGSSFRSCSIILQLRSGTTPGTYNTTLDYASVGSGSANMSGTVTEEHGSVVRITGPNNEASSYDFGPVAVGDSATRTFTVRNTGSVNMTGATWSTTGSSDYSIASTTCGPTLNIFSSCTVNVHVAPSAAGTLSGSLAANSGSGHSSSFSLTTTAMTPVADLSVSPVSYDYGATPPSHPYAKDYVVTNEGNTTLDLDFALGSGTDPNVFYDTTNGTCGSTLGVGGSCTYRVIFAPPVSGIASHTGSFTVTGTSSLVGSPATKTVDITGERGEATASIEPRDTAGLTVKPAHDFGSVAISGNASYTFSVANTGNTPIGGVTPSITGHTGRYAVTANNCGSGIARGSTCSVTVRFQPNRVGAAFGTLVLTPAAGSPQAEVESVELSGNATGLRIMNDVGQNMTAVTQKRWLDTLTLSPGGALPSDIIRTSFEVDVSAAKDLAGVEIATSTTTNDNAPGAYQNIGDLLGSKIEIERKAGSAQAIVRAEVPLSNTSLGTGNGQYGFSDGTTLVVCLGGGDYKTDDRRVWFRVRDEDGNVSQSVGSIVRFNNQNYACPDNQGPQITAQRILSIGGVSQPVGTTVAAVDKNVPITFQFGTRAKAAPLLGGDPGFVEGANWRIRNVRTGQIFRMVNGNYTACSLPCIDESNFTSGAKHIFPSRDQGTQTMEIPGIPSRGRWVVELSPQSSNGNEDDAHFFSVGTLRVNDRSGTSPNVNWAGTLTQRPDTDSDYTIAAIPTDPADPVNPLDSEGGRAQVIEWDLDGNTTNGPLGDGFETRYETDSGSNIDAGLYTRPFSTVGKTPGPYTIRVRVTDNGSFMASEEIAQTRIFEYTTTINTPPEPINDVVYLEADEDQPADIDFRVNDVDGDDHRVDIIPDGANTGNLGGNMNGPIGDNTKPYSWPADYTGTDTYEFTPTDDHKGTGPDGTLTVRVRPNTVIDQSSIAGAVLHPDVSDPANGFLGSTTTTEAEFEFSSPQNPVVAYECRHLLDGDVVEDWEECSDQSTGDIELEDLDDGLHRLEVRAVNDEGVEDGTPAFRTWRVDNTAPETEVRVGPPSNLPTQQPRYTNDSTPTYVFKATDAERSLQQYMTYECRVMWGPNAGNWLPCGSPSDTLGSGPVDIVGPNPAFGIVNPLPEGDYEIQVRATDEVGNLGPAMTEVVRIDITPPETALASGPEGLINTRNLEYVLGSSQGQSTFLCKVEGQNVGVVVPMGPCPGPAADGSRPTFTVPADDVYVLTAIAVDPAQNQDTTPLEVDFEVDATEPETTMDPEVDYGDGPTTVRRTQSRKVDVSFTGMDARQLQGYQCRLDSDDDEAWQICESPQRFSGLSDGLHRLEIRARDEAGNVDSTPEVLEWVVDRTPPTTTITAAPDPITNDADPTFEFDVDEAISGAVCSLDGEAPVPCSSPFTLADLGVTGGLADGDHTVTVKSTDIAGNVEQAAASATWRQDTVAPVVAFTSRPGAYTPLGAVNFGWSVKDGDPPVLAPEVGADCAFDPADPDAIEASEWEPCGRDLTIAEEDNENGSHTFAVRATDEAGNVSTIVSHDWMVLGAKPNPPVIDDSSPVDGATTRVGTAYFAISHELQGTGALEALLCSIDGGTRTPCGDDGTNFEVEGLDDGPHTFSVVARDIAGNVSDPTVVSWEVQRGAPVTSIDFGPNGMVNTADATFEFSSDKDGTFECKVDDGEWEPCASPVDLINLDDGKHEFRVRAVSTVAPVGVKDPTPPVRKWTVDTVAPEVTIDSAPEGDVVSYDASIRFSSDDPTASFQCQVNDRLFVDCASPWNVSGLAAGQQTVTVRAVDAAGNMSATPAQAVWVVQDPSCPDGFEGTPPNCTEIVPVEGPAITAVSTGGTLSLAALGSVDLPENQVKLEGKLGADGRWFIPAAGVKFEPVTQVIEDAIGPGTEVTVTISITATGDSWGLLPNGGGAAKLKLPVRADVEAKLGTIGLFPPGTECSLRPVTFDLNGTFDESAMTAHFEQPSVAFPKVTGCDTFKQVVDELLELPRNDIEFALDLALTVEQGSCPDGTTGTPPNCVTPPKRITLAKPAVKGTKKVRAGKAARYAVRVRNTGDAPASNAKVCLTAPRKFFRGKAQRCRTIKSIAAGKAVAPAFKLRAKRFRLKKNRKINLKAVVTYRDGDGKSRRVVGKIKPRAIKTGKVK